MKSLFLLNGREMGFTWKDQVFYGLIVLFFATLYLPTMPVINNICIALVFAFSFFYNSLKQKISLLWERKAIAAMIVFYLLHVISVLFSTNKEEAFTLLGLRIPLFMFPVAIGLVYIKRGLKDRILLAYAFITTVASLLCFFTAFAVYRSLHDIQWLYNDNLTVAIGKQSIYFALMVNLAIFSYVYLLIGNSKAVRNKAAVYGSIFFLMAINFMLASRVAIIVLYGGLAVFLVFYILQKKKYLEGATMIMGLLVVGFLLVKAFPKTLNRFRELAYTDYRYDNQGVESHYNMKLTADQWNGANIRLAVWSCGWEIFRNHPIFGGQLGDRKGMLLDIYRQRNFQFALKTERNMHNNYLDVLVTFGLVGFAIFVAAYLVFPILSCYQAKDILGAYIMIAIACTLISETYFDRSLGCVLVGFFMSFIAGYKKISQADQ